MSHRGPTRLSVAIVFLASGAVNKTIELEHKWRSHFGKKLVRVFLESYAAGTALDTDTGATSESTTNMIAFRIPRQIEQEMRDSLMRPHPFAAERVGFVFTKWSRSKRGGRIILVCGYEPVPDDDYINDPNVGARINSSAIRRAMQRALTTGEGALHVHVHDHDGPPGPSRTDRQELGPMMQSIRNASPHAVHGLLILSRDAAWIEALVPGCMPFQAIKNISVVGFPMAVLSRDSALPIDTDRFSRQSFLGASAAQNIVGCHVGIIGLGGGGSHIAQQLAHVGFSRFSLFDNDIVESSNLNRLVGGTCSDAKKRTPKVSVAARLIKGVNPGAYIEKVKSRWQDAAESVRDCDIVFGCVDSYAERRDIEIATRRYLIPYLDIGLDVHQAGIEPSRMAGQIILSMPGEQCMSCLGFLTEAKLSREAERYGAAGPRPQVVWANGVLASSAVGIAIDLLTNWTRQLRRPVYLSYDSNTGTVQPHKRLQFLDNQMCPHFPFSQLGDPTLNRL
jgi:hypothetical protein